MLANHCGPHPPHVCTTLLQIDFGGKSLFLFIEYAENFRFICVDWLLLHSPINLHAEYVCTKRVYNVTHTDEQAQIECVGLNIFIKIASNRIFSRGETCCVCVNYKFWKIERWKSGKVAGVAAAAAAASTSECHSCMAYMCKLFGILHIIYKQTIDTHTLAYCCAHSSLTQPRSQPFFGCSLIIFCSRWAHTLLHMCDCQHGRQAYNGKLQFMHEYRQHIIFRSFLLGLGQARMNYEAICRQNICLAAFAGHSYVLADA